MRPSAFPARGCADSLLGLVPGIGDVLALAPAGWIIWKARDLGAPKMLQARMAGNTAIDAMIGAIPVVGDLFDMGWKGNLRNVRLLRAHIATGTVCGHHQPDLSHTG